MRIDPPDFRQNIPLQNDLKRVIGQSDSKIKKKPNQFPLKKSKKPVNGIEFIKERPLKRSDYEDKVLQPAFARKMDKVQAEVGPENLVWSHIAHGGRKHIGVAMMHKRAGLKKGFLDNVICFSREGWPQIIFVEVKDKQIGKLTSEQKDFIRRMSNLGFRCYVIYADHPVDVEQKLSAILRENYISEITSGPDAQATTDPGVATRGQCKSGDVMPTDESLKS